MAGPRDARLPRGHIPHVFFWMGDEGGPRPSDDSACPQQAARLEIPPSSPGVDINGVFSFVFALFFVLFCLFSCTFSAKTKNKTKPETQLNSV